MDQVISIIDNADKEINKYILKKKKTILSCILMIMGVDSQFPITFPIKLCFEDLDTPENNDILNEMSSNDVINKYFSCRSLKSSGAKDKKRVQNALKQMIKECDLTAKRTPFTYYNELSGEKKTKQFYIIG